jgi:uncharacterized membrane protein YoaK (UPF0700 family)
MTTTRDATLSRDRRDALVLLLAWAAGGVDAIGFLGLNHVFTANMTGNTVLLGLALGQGRGLAAWSNVTALVSFGLGVTLGALIVGGGKASGEWDLRVTWAILCEAVMLGAFTVVWHIAPDGADRGALALYLLIAFSALAMGIQSAAVRRLNLPGVATTYVTGTMTSLLAGIAGRLRGSTTTAAASGSTDEAASEAAAKKDPVQLQASVLIIYGLSALVSGFFQTRVPWLVAVPPLFAIAVVLLLVSFAHRAHESRSEGIS